MRAIRGKTAAMVASSAGVLSLSLAGALTLAAMVGSLARAAEPLPGTSPLTQEGDLAALMVQGIHHYLDRALQQSVAERSRHWQMDFSSPEAYQRSLAPNRERLRKSLGVVDDRQRSRLEYVSGPGFGPRLAEGDGFALEQVRWAVLPGVEGEGLWLVPAPGREHRATIIALDADHTPEQLAGLEAGLAPRAQWARRLAELGFRVLIPTLIDHGQQWSANPRINRFTNQTHREFIHKMAYEMGRTLLGYEVQKVLAAVDAIEALARESRSAGHERSGGNDGVVVFGHGTGGRVGLLAAALDERIAAVVASGCFGPREHLADMPIDENIWGLLREFGDGEVLRLIFPRLAILEASGYSIPPAGELPQRANVAAPGQYRAADASAIQAERDRGLAPILPHWKHPHAPILVTPRASALPRPAGESPPPIPPACDDTLLALLEHFGGVAPLPKEPALPLRRLRPGPNPAERLKRQFDQLVAHVQKLWRDSEPVRKARFHNADASSPRAWDASVQPLRDFFHAEVIGQLPEPTRPLHPRTRVVYEEPTWTGYEVMLDVYPEVFASGILLVPKGLKPDQRRPVVVCQHGLEGTPRKVIDYEKENRPYNHFARRLVEKGYVVYAPQNPYYGGNAFRQINRKANPLKLSLFSFIIRQHQRTLDWLQTLPFVDPQRIGFYGLSYGGKTAMRVPAIEKRYALVICSGDFNEWIGKVVSTELDRSYMWTQEYEMYEFDLGHTFNYAEMAALIAPRPFMVERGHEDRVGTDEMVAYEFAKVRYLYAQRLGLAERAEIEFFVGGHQIHAQGTFRFLDRFLRGN